MPSPVIDMTDADPDEVLTAFGHLVAQSIQRSGAAVFLQKPDGSVTILDPKILLSVPDEVMAQALVTCWPEEDVEAYFADKYARESGER